MRKFLLIITILLTPTICLGGVDFDGVDDIVNCGDMTSIDSALTIAAWINVDSLAADEYVVLAKYDNTSNAVKEWLFRILATAASSCPQGALNFITHDGTTQKSACTTTGLTVDTWNHVAVVFSGGAAIDGSTIAFYLNGNLLTEDATLNATSSPQNSATVITMGKWSVTSSDLSDGTTGDVAIWDTQLTANEIAQLALSRTKRIPLQIQKANLKAYWPLDDEEDGSSADADTFLDMTGNGNTCTGSDGANNTGLTAKAEEVLSYPE